jgi:MoaA/NifB/PqqE/SkfB family radical SAM enzyme
MKKIPYYSYCTNPWEEFILHADLSYTPCCFGPKVGKIHSVEEIDEVWNGPTIRQIRRDLLQGVINPMCSDCPRYKIILNRTQVEVEDNWTHPYPTDYSPAIKRLNLLITEKCNLRCIMCNATGVYPNRLKDGISIPFPFIRRLGEKYFSRLEFLNPNCFGEFFVYENFADYLDLVEQYRPTRVEFNTNGSLNISEDIWLRVLKSHTVIGFSVDAATPQTYHLIRRNSNWDNVFRNVDKIHRLRDKHGLKNELRFNFVIMKINLHELYAFVQKAIFEWGANGLALMHVDGAKNAPRYVLNDSEWRVRYNQELRQIETLRGKLKDVFITKLDYAYDADGNIEGLSGSHASSRPAPTAAPVSSDLGAEALRSLAKTYFQSGAFAEAADLYAKVCHLLPTDTESLICQAECRFRQGHLTVAKLLFEEAVESGANNAMARQRLNHLQAQDRQAEALVASPAH